MAICHGCKKNIVGAYIEALGHQWHHEHFVCTVCNKPFQGQQFFEQDGNPYCEKDYFEKFGKRCAACGEFIRAEYVQALDQYWHKEHFVCTICKKPFDGRGFLQRDGKPYCERDYLEMFATKCSICTAPIQGEFFEDNWGNSFCLVHQSELDKCFSCTRLICKNLTGGGVEYSDTRRICNLCRKTAIDDDQAAKPLFAQVQKVLTKLGLGVDGTNIPMRVASLDEIDRLAGGTPQTEAGISLLQTQMVNGVETGRIVKEVVILYGLPREHTAAIMAHEIGHVWCFLHRMPSLPLQVQEGICEMFAFSYLSEVNTPESEYHRNAIARNEDPIYGEGFRKIYGELKGRSLVAFLDDVKKKGLA